MEYLETLKFIFIEGERYKVLINGLFFSFFVTLSAAALGLAVGMILALFKIIHFYPFKKIKKLQNFNPLNSFATIYIDLIRGTPVVVQLMIINSVIFVGKLKGTPIFIIAFTAFGVNSAAYIAEIIRAGIEGLPKGQMEAARSLGMSYPLAMKEVILPQAIKRILPTLVNEFIVLLKETSIVGFIGGVDLLRSANIITSQVYRGIEPLVVVGLIYFILVGVFTKLMRILERKMKESD